MNESDDIFYHNNWPEEPHGFFNEEMHISRALHVVQTWQSLLAHDFFRSEEIQHYIPSLLPDLQILIKNAGHHFTPLYQESFEFYVYSYPPYESSDSFDSLGRAIQLFALPGSNIKINYSDFLSMEIHQFILFSESEKPLQYKLFSLSTPGEEMFDKEIPSASPISEQGYLLSKALELFLESRHPPSREEWPDLSVHSDSVVDHGLE